MFVPAVPRQAEIRAEVAAIERELAPDVVRIRLDFGEDWSGDPAAYFKVILSDETVKDKERFKQITRRARARLDEVDFSPLRMFVYQNFRGFSEQAQLNDPSWA